ncbi:Peptidylprolyl isomerase [Cryptosporidium felis]|nr:Peptidylprolyl isomerase [Cryptosporidium felis]
MENGLSDEKPRVGDLVYVKYKTFSEDNPMIESITNMQKEIKYSFIIGSGVVDPQVEEKICNLTPGQETSVPLSSNDSGFPSLSSEYPEKERSSLQITVELLSFTRKEDVPELVSSTLKIFSSPLQRMQLSLDSKNKGNHFYNMGDFQNAKIHYQNSLKYLENLEEWTPDCLLKLGEYKPASKYSSEALKLEKVSLLSSPFTRQIPPLPSGQCQSPLYQSNLKSQHERPRRSQNRPL